VQVVSIIIEIAEKIKKRVHYNFCLNIKQKMFKYFIRNTLQRYVLREWFQTFWPSFLCFETLIFLGFAVEVLHKGLDIIALRALIPHIFIQAAPYSIPSALLTATTLTYGRMSADREIVAIQASGIRLQKIILPVFLIGILFSIFTLALSAEILPRSLYRIKLLQERAINNILAGRLATFQKKVNLDTYQIYIGNVENNTNKDITVLKYVDDYITDIILAEEGAIQIDEAKSMIFLTLRNGEFVKPNYKKPEEIPRIGLFEQTTFEIPLNKAERKSSTKHMTIFQLLEFNEKIDKELATSKGVPAYTKKQQKELYGKLATYQEELKELNKELKMLNSQLKQSEKTLSRQRSKIDGLKNESRLARNYILVASENLTQLKRQSKGSFYINKDIDVKMQEIKETIEREKQRVHNIEQKIVKTQEAEKKEIGNIASLSQEIAKVKEKRDAVIRKITGFEEDLTLASKQESRRDNNIRIHKRISQALSCISFIVIGIPLGIRLRSSHLMIGFGASFMVILFVYYPLVVTGSVLADDTQLPVVPVLWAADIVLFVSGIVLYRKLFAHHKL